MLGIVHSDVTYLKGLKNKRQQYIILSTQMGNDEVVSVKNYAKLRDVIFGQAL